jgi:hypothetical protein
MVLTPYRSVPSSLPPLRFNGPFLRRMYHTNLNHPTTHQVLISLLPFLPPSSSTKPTSWFSPSFQATKHPTNTIDRSLDQSSDQSSDDSPLFAFHDRSIGPPTPFHRISWFLVSAPRNLDYLIAKSLRFWSEDPSRRV